MSDIVFMDTETLGLDIDAPIWEFAAIRRKYLGEEIAAEKVLHLFIRHRARPWIDSLPEQFAADYRARYSDLSSVSQLEAAETITEFLDGRPHIVGAVPGFDTERIARQLLEPNRIPRPWHYHLIDVENLALGFLKGRNVKVAPPYKSDDLSRLLSVDPDHFDRHTALGDVEWVKAQYDAVMGGAK